MKLLYKTGTNQIIDSVPDDKVPNPLTAGVSVKDYTAANLAEIKATVTPPTPPSPAQIAAAAQAQARVDANTAYKALPLGVRVAFALHWAAVQNMVAQHDIVGALAFFDAIQGVPVALAPQQAALRLLVAAS